MINVLLVEDKKMSRECLEGYIAASGRYTLAASISNAGMAEMTCMRYPVDIILMDVCTENNESGLVAAAGIKRKMPEIKIVVVTSMMDSSFLQKAKQAGAESFWYKESSPEELLTVREEARRIQAILHDLPEPYREVFMWRVFADLSYKQIGDIFSKTDNWACVTYHRARKMIKNRLEDSSHEK